MKKLYVHHNAKCIDCLSIFTQMVRVGAFVMCVSCATKFFPDGYDSGSEAYRERLNKYLKPS